MLFGLLNMHDYGDACNAQNPPYTAMIQIYPNQDQKAALIKEKRI